jgi:hypothetical protein
MKAVQKIQFQLGIQIRISTQIQNSNAGGAERLSNEELALTHVAPPPLQASSAHFNRWARQTISAKPKPIRPSSAARD